METIDDDGNLIWSDRTLFDSSGSLSIDWENLTYPSEAEIAEKLKRQEVYKKRLRVIEKILKENEKEI